MATTLAEVKERARGFLRAADYPSALRCYEQILSALPGDPRIRLKIADLLVKLAMIDEAMAIYDRLGVPLVRAGYPLLALCAAQALAANARSGDLILREMAAVYSSDSPLLARLAVPPAPEDPARELPDADTGAASLPFDALVDRCAAGAADLSAWTDNPSKYHPLPFFSSLGAHELYAVLGTLTVRRLGERELVMRQGDLGDALFLVASGDVVVFTTDAEGQPHELARLAENSLFGEMALITAQPRSASVIAIEGADIVEVSRAALERVTSQLPAVAVMLDGFARERLIKNLLATSPLFTPFSPSQQTELLKRFEGLELAPGALAIAEGQPGTGLFVVLSGAVEVVSTSSGSETLLAQLHSGDVFGEMSLLGHQLTSATVRASAPTTVLFLHRDYFGKLVAAIPELSAYFETLAQQRAADTGLKLGRRSFRGSGAPATSGWAPGDDHRLLI